MYTRNEILENRKTWIEFQSKKGRRKGTGSLDLGNGVRCCLGHACRALNIPKYNHPIFDNIHYGEENEYSDVNAPDMLVEKLGLWDEEGGICPDKENLDQRIAVSYKKYEFNSLITLNDRTTIKASEIGEYLASVIEGGVNTPFRPLTDYPETKETSE